MNIKKTFTVGIFIFTLFDYSNAITLDELVEILKEKNPTLNRQKIEKSISKTEKSKANRERLGKLELFSTFYRYEDKRVLYPITPPVNPTNLVGARNQLNVGIRYTVPIFTGFKLERKVEIKKLNKKLTDIRYYLTKNELIFNLKILYLKTLSLYKTKEALLTYKNSLETLYKNIDEMVKVGKKPEVDLLKVKYELESVNAKIEKSNNSIDSLKSSIKTLIGDESLDLSNMEDIKFSKVSYEKFDIEELYRLKAEYIKEKIGDLKIDIAKGDYFPEIYLNASIQRNMGNSEYKDIWQVGLNLNYTLFDFGVRKRKYIKSVLEKKKIIEEKRKTVLEIKNRLREALNNIKTAEANIKAFKKQLEYAKEVEDIEREKYMEGVSGLYDYLKAKAQRYLAESEYYNSLYDREIQITYLKYLLEEFKNE
ncbi:MAG: hypothetical protein DSY59_00530 [Persephonella sp.]|nr:MAG: hypothetical protein DSY59_00530 [Persephonella sp.]